MFSSFAFYHLQMYLHRILICETGYVVDRLTGRYFYLKFESLTKKMEIKKLFCLFVHLVLTLF